MHQLKFNGIFTITDVNKFFELFQKVLDDTKSTYSGTIHNYDLGEYIDFEEVIEDNETQESINEITEEEVKNTDI